MSVAALLLSVVASPSASAQTERRTLGGRDIALYNIAGEVTVERGSGSDVVVEITRGGRDAGRLRIVEDEIRGSNTLRVLYPEGDIVYPGTRRTSSRASDRDVDRDDDRYGSRGGDSYSAELRLDRDGMWGNSNRWDDGRRVRIRSRGDGTEAWADIRVLVPRGRTVKVHLGVGQLDANGVDADLTLDVAAARVTATGTRGALSIDAGSGSVSVRDATATEMTIDTGSGSVSISGVSADRCTFETGSGTISGDRVTCDDAKFDTGSGGIRMDDVRAPNAAFETGSGGVQVNLVTSPRSLAIESGSGSVVVRLPSDVDAEVMIETGSGGITTDFGIATNRVERNRLQGRIGRGTGRITVETGSGSVRLLKR